jgi:tetratricopeptide (TPR) repeat protein
VYDIFLSYNQQDHKAVETVATALRQRNVKVFLARWYLAPGQPWIDVLERTLGECRAVAIFLGPHGLGRWQQREKEVALERHAREPDFPVIPVLLPRAVDPPLGFLTLYTWVDLRDAQSSDMVEALARAAGGQPVPREGSDGPPLPQICPYRGLQHFREEDKEFFCGRAAFTGKLVDEVRARSFIAVVGASGSGKSSVVHAGLIPELRQLRRNNGDDQQWEMVVLSPKDHPLHELAKRLVPLLQPELEEIDKLSRIEKLADLLAKGKIRLRAIIDSILERQPGTGRLLLVVDQWEELYTLSRDEADKALGQRFVQHLLDASADSRLTVVLTLRADFFANLVSDRSLSDRLQGGIVNIAPMTPDELRSAIAEPARKVGLRFEEGLVERILNAVGNEPGRLPLLEFLLAGLWDKRRGGQLLHEAYDAMDGVQGAIADRAERAFERLTAPEKQAAHWALIQLVASGRGPEATRRQAALNQLGAAARSVVEKLANERLLVTTQDAQGQEIVEVGHEALISEWRRLREWVDEDRHFLRIRTDLDEQATTWGAQHGPADDLLIPAGRRLAEAEELLKERPQMVGLLLRRYIDASVAAEKEKKEVEKKAELDRLEEKARDARRWASVLAVLLVITIGCGYWVYLSKKQADAEARHAQEQTELANLLKLTADQHAADAQRQAKRAEEQTQQAKSNLAVALTSTSKLINKIRPMLGKGEMSAELAKELLTEAERTLRDLGRQNPDIAKPQTDLLLAISDAFAILGETAQARKRAEQARNLAEKLATAERDNLEWQSVLFGSAFRIGDALAQHGDLYAANREYRLALNLAEQLAVGDPSNWDPYRSFIHNKLGDVQMLWGDLSAALDEYRKGQTIVEQIGIKKPGPNWERELSASRERIGNAQKKQKDFDQALTTYRSVLEIRERLLVSDHDNDGLKTNLATTRARIGEVLIAIGDVDGALQEYRKMLNVRIQLASKDRRNAVSQSNLAFGYQFMGDAWKAKGDLRRALEQHHAALEIRQQLARDDPSNVVRQAYHAMSLGRIGDVFAAQDEHENAVEQYRAAIAILQQLVAKQPDNSPRQEDIFVIQTKLADVLAARSNREGAIEAYRVALERAEARLHNDPGIARWQVSLPAIYIRIGDLMKELGKTEDALFEYRHALKRADDLAFKEPNIAERQADVAAGHVRIADLLVEEKGLRPQGPFHTASDDLTTARRAYQSAIEILERLMATYPKSREWQSQLVAVKQRSQIIALK